MCGGVPTEKTVHDGAAKAHLLAWLWVGVEWVVVTVEAVEEGGFWGKLEFIGCGRLLAGWWIVDWVLLAWFVLA